MKLEAFLRTSKINGKKVKRALAKKKKEHGAAGGNFWLCKTSIPHQKMLSVQTSTKIIASSNEQMERERNIFLAVKNFRFNFLRYA